MDDTENPTPESDETAETAPRAGAGELIRAARERAGIPASKLCADLRISPATLAALEAGEYAKLAGAPYVRAMFVSLSRHLRIDTREVLAAYEAETGAQTAPSVQVSPYKDDSGTHAKAHKQIFILLLAVLLFILVLIMGKVNTSSPEPAAGSPADTLLHIDPSAMQDSSVSADSTLGDSLATVGDSALAPPAEEETASETRVRILGLADSVWIRVLPAGERESSLYLRRNKPAEFSHVDAITFITRQGGTVRVFLGDSSVIPPQRRFKVDGDQIDY